MSLSDQKFKHNIPKYVKVKLRGEQYEHKINK